jgi:hypothetical protein
MKTKIPFFHCGEQLQNTLAKEIHDVKLAVNQVPWVSSFEYIEQDNTHAHQTGYNKAFAAEFNRLGWDSQPRLRSEPNLIGDFRK